jgi:hypothetical protein
MPITLTNEVTLKEGATVVQDDTVSVIAYVAIDFIGNTLSILVQNGKMVDGSFVLDTLLPQDNEINMDLTTGNWTDWMSNSGTANPTVLAAQLSQFKTSRNGGEQFVISTGTVQGTFTPWV